MPKRYLYEIVNELKNISPGQPHPDVWEELNEWADMQRGQARLYEEEQASHNRNPAPSIPVPPPTIPPARRTAQGARDNQRTVNPNLASIVPIESDAQLNAELQAKLQIEQIQNAFHNIVKASGEQINSLHQITQTWLLDVHAQEQVKEERRSQSKIDATLDLEQTQVLSQRKNVLIEALQGQINTLNRTLEEKAHTAKELANNLPPFYKTEVYQQIQTLQKQQTLTWQLQALVDHVQAIHYAYLSQEGSKQRIDLLNLDAFDTLKTMALNKNMPLHNILDPGARAYWPQFFKPGIHVHADHLKSKKKFYFDKDFVQNICKADRLTHDTQKELSKFLEHINIINIENDEMLYCALKMAIRLTLSEQPLNLEKIEGKGARSGAPIAFLKIKSPESTEAFEPIDSEEDFLTAWRLGLDVRTILTSTIDHYLDRLYDIAKKLPTVNMSEPLKKQIFLSIQQSLGSFKAAIYKKVQATAPDDNLMDIFKATQAARKISNPCAPGIAQPGIAHLFIEIEHQCQRGHQYLDQLTRFQQLQLTFMAYEEEYKALNQLPQEAHRIEALQKIFVQVQNEMKNVINTLRTQDPDLKIKDQPTTCDFTKKREWDSFKIYLSEKSKKQKNHITKIAQLNKNALAIDESLSRVAMYEAQELLDDLTAIQEQLNTLETQSPEVMSISNEYLPFQALTTSHRDEIVENLFAHLFKIPALPFQPDLEKKKEISLTCIRDYRGLYFNKNNDIMPCEQLIQDPPENQEEFVRLLAHTIEGAAHEPGLITNQKEWKNVSCELSFLSWEQKKALSAFIMPSDFKLTQDNFIEVQKAINESLIGTFSSKVGLKDIMILASGLKFRKSGCKPSANADMRDTFNPPQTDFHCTQSLASCMQNCKENIGHLTPLKSLPLESLREPNFIQSTTPVSLHKALISKFPQNVKTMLYSILFDEQFPLLYTEGTNIFDNPSYEKLICAILKKCTQTTAQALNEKNMPTFLTLIKDAECSAALNEKYLKYFNAYQGNDKAASGALQGFVAAFFDTLSNKTLKRSTIDEFLGFIQEQVQDQTLLETLIFEYQTPAQILEKLLFDDPLLLPSVIAELEYDIEKQYQQLTTPENIVSQTSFSFQNGMVQLLKNTKSELYNRYFNTDELLNAAKNHFAKNLNIMQGRLSAVALAAILPLNDHHSFQGTLFGLEGPALIEFNHIYNQFQQNLEDKLEHHITNRIIQNACLNIEKMRSLAQDLNNRARTPLDLDVQDFDAFHDQLHIHLKNDLHETKGSEETFYTILELSTQEKNAISLEINALKLEAEQSIRSTLARFLVKTATKEHLLHFIDSVQSEMQCQFIRDNLGDKTLLLQFSPELLVHLFTTHYEEIMNTISPQYAIEIRERCIAEQKEHQVRHNTLQNAAHNAKIELENATRLAQERRRTQDRAEFLGMKNESLERDIAQMLKDLGLSPSAGFVNVLKEIRLLKSHLDTLPILTLTEQIEQMNVVIFPKLKQLKIQLTHSSTVPDLSPNDQQIATIAAQELAECNNLFLTKGLELGAIAINNHNIPANAKLNENLTLARFHNAEEILHLRQELAQARKQLERDTQPTTTHSDLVEEQKRRAEAERKQEETLLQLTEIQRQRNEEQRRKEEIEFELLQAQILHEEEQRRLAEERAQAQSQQEALIRQQVEDQKRLAELAQAQKQEETLKRQKAQEEQRLQEEHKMLLTQYAGTQREQEEQRKLLAQFAQGKSQKEEELAQAQRQQEVLRRQQAQAQQSMAAQLASAQQRIAEMTTPASILQSQGIAGLDNAILLYKRTHNGAVPTYKEAQGWLTMAQLKDRSILRAIPGAIAKNL